jgi:hypothetical protein
MGFAAKSGTTISNCHSASLHPSPCSGPVPARAPRHADLDEGRPQYGSAVCCGLNNEIFFPYSKATCGKIDVTINLV